MLILPVLSMILVLGTPQTRLVALEPKISFPPDGRELVKVISDISPGIPFREMIASWNIEPAISASFKLEVRIHKPDGHSKWYTMAYWALDNTSGKRESLKGQGDEDGNVDTDTLTLKKDADQLDARVTIKKTTDGPVPVLKLLTFSFSDRTKQTPDVADHSPAWGKSIDVPQRAQGNYPNGGVLCSPTSMSMMLGYYSNALNRPELNKDVLEVEYHVWDPVYKGAGNWPFNTAYVGSFPGMRSYVTRLNRIQDLERWISAGYPVVCSVSFDLLRGLELSPTESGHLVVLVGFDETGNPVINDPAFKNQVRRIYKRSDFEKAWNYSNRTVYLVYPEGAPIPADTEGIWYSGS